MGVVTFTARAYSDIFRLRAFVEQESPRAAEVAVARIFEGIDLLALFPRAGIPVRRDIRRLIIRYRRDRLHRSLPCHRGGR